MDTYIFLGATLPLDEARELMDARYLPPIRCGDILKLLRLKPRRILIIDGVFEQDASVWHKEILFALSCGVEIYGASSMGALRAAELDSFGMRGIGETYTLYRSGKINDDGDVAVSFTQLGDQFRALNDAKINQKALLSLQYQQGKLNKATFEKKLAALERLFYVENSTFCADDLKKQDAIAALRYLKNTPIETTPTKLPLCPNTIYLRALIARCNASSFIEHFEWLPDVEKLCLRARYLGDTYRLLKTTALMLQVLEQYGQAWPVPTEVSISNPHLLLPKQLEDTLDANVMRHLKSLSPEHVKATFRQLVLLSGLQQIASRLPMQTMIDRLDVENYFGRVLYLQSLLFTLIQEKLVQVGVDIQPTTLNKYSIHFREIHALKTKDQFNDYLAQNNLTHEDYLSLIKAFAVLDYFILKGNTQVFGEPHSVVIQNHLYKIIQAIGLADVITDNAFKLDQDKLQRGYQHYDFTSSGEVTTP